MSSGKKTVWVHAWEYVNPGPRAGGGGFNWYAERDRAVEAYENAERSDGWAHFFFPYQTEEGESPEETTKAIDNDLHEACAHSYERNFGRDVLAYWKANHFQMGDDVSPAGVAS